MHTIAIHKKFDFHTNTSLIRTGQNGKDCMNNNLKELYRMLGELKEDVKIIKEMIVPKVKTDYDPNWLSERYLDEIKNTKSHNTCITYEKGMDYFREYINLNKINPFEITKAQVYDYRRLLLDKGFHHRSINARMTVVRAFYTWLMNNDYIEHNPILKINLKIAKLLPNPVPIDDVYAILKQLKQMAIDDYLSIYTCVACGCRVSEVPNIKVKDIMILDNGTISIRIIGKGEKERITLSIFKEFDELVKKHIHDKNPDDYFVFSNRPIEDINTIQKYIDRIKYICKKLVKKFGIPKFSPHRLRHTYGTEILKREVKAERLAKLMGHANIQTTLGYSAIVLSDIIPDIEKIKL